MPLVTCIIPAEYDHRIEQITTHQQPAAIDSSPAVFFAAESTQGPATSLQASGPLYGSRVASTGLRLRRGGILNAPHPQAPTPIKSQPKQPSRPQDVISSSLDCNAIEPAIVQPGERFDMRNSISRVFLALRTILTLAEITKGDISLPQLRTQLFETSLRTLLSIADLPTDQQTSMRLHGIHCRSQTDLSTLTVSIHKPYSRNNSSSVGWEPESRIFRIGRRGEQR